MAAALRANGKTVLLGSELEYLGRVIGQVEQNTSGELRMMIVRRSGRVPLAAPLYFLSFSTLALIAMWFDRVQLLAAPEWTLPAVLTVSAALGALLARWPRAAAWVYPQIDRRIAAQTRAEVEFYRRGMTNTRERTGILIFVSLFERQAVVMADQGIAEKCPPSTWDGVIATILQGAQQERWAPKLEDAIRQCGELLTEHFPLREEPAEVAPAPEPARLTRIHSPTPEPTALETEPAALEHDSTPVEHEQLELRDAGIEDDDHAQLELAPTAPAAEAVARAPEPAPPAIEAAPMSFRPRKFNELPNDIIVDD